MAIKGFRRETLCVSIFPTDTPALFARHRGLPVNFTRLVNLCPGFRLISLIPQNGIKSNSLASLESSLDAQT
jgi:hypothetical protein